MRETKIVVVGAGSASFGLNNLRDAFQSTHLRGSELCLVDVNEERLAWMTKLAQKMNDVSGEGLEITSNTDRKKALPGAEFVITCIAIKRNELWKKDWEIPRKHGVRHVLGENGGPGGLSHALRNIPMIMDIARDMEKLCPDAWLVNFTNPESRICRAVNKYSAIKTVGLCHGISMGRDNVAYITGIPAEDIDVLASGINHFTWFHKITNKNTGENLYPLLSEKCKNFNPKFMPFSRYLYEKFGLFPSPSDDHVGEYFAYAYEMAGEHGYDFSAADFLWEGLWDTIKKMADGTEDVKGLLSSKSGEIAFEIIEDIVVDRASFRLSVNIQNNGLLKSVPDFAVVEVPAVVDRIGVHGVACPDLPEPVTAMCAHQTHIQELCVDAAVKGSRKLALEALLVDPVIHSTSAAEKILDEFLSVHKEFLPQFQ